MNDLLDINPDLAAAQRFLDALGGSPNFTYMALAEGAKKGTGAPLVLHGTLEQYGAKLVDLNRRGYGVFVMVNEGDMRGRKAENVVKVRRHFVDLDGVPVEPVLECAAPPCILVCTSPDRYHAYWPDYGCPLGAFKQRQQALAAKFGGDTTVCDLPRVMRLPGFFHLKTMMPFLVKMIDVAGTAKENQP
jgi:hypothetical protein